VRHPLAIGLTGGVASGKSTVALLFERLGAPVLDADLVGREVVAPGSPALARIAERFGPAFLLADGGLDRRRMRERVFADPAALRELEAITHPLIRERIRAWRDAQATPYCMLSAAILVEARMDVLVERILVVDVPVEAQLARLVGRDGIAEPLARQMIAAQASREQRLARAHDVLDNTGPESGLAPQVERLHQLYLRLAKEPSPALAPPKG
jgi:dephospho-CoA kinase